jgi:hypothetical protein
VGGCDTSRRRTTERTQQFAPLSVHDSQHIDFENTSTFDHSSIISPPKCHCDLKERTQVVSQAAFSTDRLTLYDKAYESSRHIQTCHLHYLKSTKRSLGAKFRIPWSQNLSSIVEAAFHWRYELGRFSLSPTLVYRPVVKNSPTKTLIYNTFDNIRLGVRLQRPGNDLIPAVAALERKLLQLYQTKEASPYETDEYGRTHLHVWSS